MRLVSFDMLRTVEIPAVRTIKPTHWFREKESVRDADWVLFPEYWQVNPLVYAWKKKIFPSVSTYHIGHDKIEMIRAFEAVCPVHVPFTRILPNTEWAAETILEEFHYPFVAKEVRSACGDGVFLIGNRAEWLNYTRRVDILFAQEYLPIRRDLRVVVVGDRCVAAYWREAPDGCFHNNVARGGAISFDRIPVPALHLVENVAGQLSVDHAGFDVAEVDGHYYLLEFNLWFGTRALSLRGVRLGRVIHEYLQRVTPAPQRPDRPLFPKAG